MHFHHTGGKDALGLALSLVGFLASVYMHFRFPSVSDITQFFNQFVATVLGIGAVASAVAIAWPKVIATSRAIRADLIDTKITAEANTARIASLEAEAVALRAKAADADARVHMAHKLARQAMNQATNEVVMIRTEAAAEIAALKADLAQFHERYHGTVAVVNKLNLESEVREREARKSNDPDRDPTVPTHVVIDNLDKLADLDVLDSSPGMPVIGPEGTTPERDRPGDPEGPREGPGIAPARPS